MAHGACADRAMEETVLIRFRGMEFDCVLTLVFLLLMTCQSGASDLRAAAGKTDITPEQSVFIAGYENNRRSESAHDHLMARCLVLDSGGTRLAFVSCDVIGLFRTSVQHIRAQVKMVASEHLFIAATHTHSGPDTMGMWGADIAHRGVDDTWLTDVEHKVAALVDETAAHLQPATLKFTHTTDVPRISKNIRVPKILDTELGVMEAVGNDGRPIATLVNYACHPEILHTHQLTADFPHALYETVEAQGGVCLYFNGAQGGMITADYDDTPETRDRNWQAAQTIGAALGQRTLAILKEASTAADTTLHTSQRVFRVPLDNKRFVALIRLGVFPKTMQADGTTQDIPQIETEVNRIRIGPAEFLTLPGEVLPNIGLYLKHEMSGEPKFLLGLCCDELGYILTPEDYWLDLYKYEASVSVGPQMGALLVQNLRSLLAAPPTAEPSTKN